MVTLTQRLQGPHVWEAPLLWMSAVLWRRVEGSFHVLLTSVGGAQDAGWATRGLPLRA